MGIVYFWFQKNNAMKRLIFLLFTCSVSYHVIAQGCSDTLQVSRNYKTILIFPENISESILGNDFGFIVDLPKSDGSKYHGRILKLYYDELATETKNFTNHTVITASGNVYDFILELTQRPEKLTWYIDPKMAIANIDTGASDKVGQAQFSSLNSKEPLKHQDTTSVAMNKFEESKRNSLDRATRELYENDPIEYYRLRCYYMQFDKAKISRYFARLDNVFLWLKGVYYNRDELYFQFRIENKEGLDLDINFIKFHMATNYRNSSSNQRLELTPLFVYKQPKTVAGKSENHFVMVFKKFALDEKKEVVVELDEASGSRNVSLKIGHEIINNPIHF